MSSTSKLDSLPLIAEVGSAETLTLLVDGSQYLPPNTTATSATPSLTDELTGVSAAANIQATTLIGTDCFVTVGPGLTRGRTYELLLQWLFSNGESLTSRTILKVTR